LYWRNRESTTFVRNNGDKHLQRTIFVGVQYALSGEWQMKSGWSVKLFLIVMTVSLLMAVGGAREAQAQLQARPCGPDSVPPVLKVLFWQGSGGADFKPACREHDRCYTKGSGRLKADCDCEFLHRRLVNVLAIHGVVTGERKSCTG
jgi:hypothetical protein